MCCKLPFDDADDAPARLPDSAKPVQKKALAALPDFLAPSGIAKRPN